MLPALMSPVLLDGQSVAQPVAEVASDSAATAERGRSLASVHRAPEAPEPSPSLNSEMARQNCETAIANGMNMKSIVD